MQYDARSHPQQYLYLKGTYWWPELNIDQGAHGSEVPKYGPMNRKGEQKDQAPKVSEVRQKVARDHPIRENSDN